MKKYVQENTAKEIICNNYRMILTAIRIIRVQWALHYEIAI